DHDERMRLWIWSLLLPRLAGAYGHGAKTPPPLPTARMQRFNDIVRSYFSPEIRQEDDDVAERARREPLSLLEQELVPARITDSVDSATRPEGMGRGREDLHASRTHDAGRLGSSGRRAPEDASSPDRHTIDREIAAPALPPVDPVRPYLRDKAGVLR